MTSVVVMAVICEVDMLVAIVVTKLLVIVVEMVGIGIDDSLLNYMLSVLHLKNKAQVLDKPRAAEGYGRHQGSRGGLGRR